MKIDLKNYLNSRDKIKEYEQTPGPVVTISREFGCDATPIAKKLIKRIEEHNGAMSHQEWKIISKEILDDVAMELKVSPVKIHHLMDTKQHNAIENVFSSLGSHYGASNQQIIEAIKEVMWLYANKGRTVMVGRGGAFIANKINHSLHVRLEAPLEWRVNKICEKRQMDEKDACQLVLEMDEKREAWIEHLVGKNVDQNVYDITFNKSTIDEDTIVDILMNLLADREIIDVSLLDKMKA